MSGADGTAIEACCSIQSTTSLAAATRWGTDARRAGGIRQFGAGPGLLLNSFPCSPHTATLCSVELTAAAPATATSFYRDVVGAYFRNMHLDVLAVSTP